MTTISFDRERVARMGAEVEVALSEKENTKEQNILLQYAKKFLECRNEENDIPKLLREFRKIREKLEKIKEKEDVEALNLWLRGSRKRPQETLDMERERKLFNHIKVKLEKLNEA